MYTFILVLYICNKWLDIRFKIFKRFYIHVRLIFSFFFMPQHLYVYIYSVWSYYCNSIPFIYFTIQVSVLYINCIHRAIKRKTKQDMYSRSHNRTYFFFITDTCVFTHFCMYYQFESNLYLFINNSLLK